MDGECNGGRRHYDINMSKRTRKPMVLGETNGKDAMINEEKDAMIVDPGNKDDHLGSVFGEDDDGGKWPVAREDGGDRESLRRLFDTRAGEGSKGRSSLGQHFTEEERQLQLVRKQKHEGSEGVKLKGMVTRYAKVLSHMIKIKRDTGIGARKRRAFWLTK